MYFSTVDCLILNIMSLILYEKMSCLWTDIFKGDLNGIDLKIKYQWSIFQPPISHLKKKGFTLQFLFLFYVLSFLARRL